MSGSTLAVEVLATLTGEQRERKAIWYVCSPLRSTPLTQCFPATAVFPLGTQEPLNTKLDPRSGESNTLCCVLACIVKCLCLLSESHQCGWLPLFLEMNRARQQISQQGCILQGIEKSRAQLRPHRETGRRRKGPYLSFL